MPDVSMPTDVGSVVDLLRRADAIDSAQWPKEHHSVFRQFVETLRAKTSEYETLKRSHEECRRALDAAWEQTAVAGAVRGLAVELHEVIEARAEAYRDLRAHVAHLEREVSILRLTRVIDQHHIKTVFREWRDGAADMDFLLRLLRAYDRVREAAQAMVGDDWPCDDLDRYEALSLRIKQLPLREVPIEHPPTLLSTTDVVVADWLRQRGYRVTPPAEEPSTTDAPTAAT